MQIKFIEHAGLTIAHITADKILVSNTQDAVDLMMNCSFQGADCLMLEEHHLHPEFFNLKTKVAGDILQKFSTYRMRLIIIGNFEKFESKSLNDFIYESNKGARVIFKPTATEAFQILDHRN